MKIIILFLFLLLLPFTSLADDEGVPASIAVKEAIIKVKLSNGITILTIPGANTNGEDLKCIIYELFGGDGAAGGIDCNWTPAHLSKRSSIR